MQKFYASINLEKQKKRRGENKNGTYFTKKHYDAF